MTLTNYLVNNQYIDYNLANLKGESMKLGQRLQEMMDVAGFSINVCSKYLGISRFTLHRVLKGYDVRLSTLVKICDFFNVTADYALGHEEL